MLNGFDRNGQQIVDQADFFLQKRLRIGHAAEHAVESRHGFYAGANLVMGREQVLAGVLIAELRFVRQNGSEFPLELFADIDDKRGPNLVVERRIDDLRSEEHTSEL